MSSSALDFSSFFLFLSDAFFFWVSRIKLFSVSRSNFDYRRSLFTPPSFSCATIEIRISAF